MPLWLDNHWIKSVSVTVKILSFRVLFHIEVLVQHVQVLRSCWVRSMPPHIFISTCRKVVYLVPSSSDALTVGYRLVMVIELRRF